MKFLGLILLLLPIGPIFGQDLAGLVRDVDQTLSVRNAFGQVIGNACLIAGTLVETAPLCALTTTTPTQQNLAHRKQLLGQACKGINTLAGGTLDATGGQVRAMATEDGVKASFRKQVGTKIRNYLSSGNLEQKKAEIWRMLGHEGVPDHSGDGIVFDLTMQTLQGNNWEQKEEVKRMLNSLGDVWATYKDNSTDNGRQRCNAAATPPPGFLASLGISNPPAQIDSTLCAQVAQDYVTYEENRQEQIYTPARMQKLDSMLNGMKSEMEALVDRMPCATPLEKLEMKNRIHNATIVPAQSSFNLRSESSACCMRNDDGSHSIHFPPAYLAQLSGGNAKLVEQVMAHELAHAMDGQEPNRTEKYKRACPVLGEGLAQCIGNKYNLGNYPKATDSLFTESFADNMANELINARVKSTDAEKRITPQEVARRACMLNATAGGATTYTGDSHPNGTDRATQLLAGPDVRKALGCPKCAPFATAKTCGVTK